MSVVYSSGMTCPAPDFVEESFLRTAKNNLSEEGIFVINLVARSQAIKDSVVSRMKEVRLQNSHLHQLYSLFLVRLNFERSELIIRWNL